MPFPVKHFHSGMPGAPVLNGTAGSLLVVLDACLIDGFGLQTASSVVVSAGVATATLPSTPAATPEAIVLVSGATPANLNGEQRVLSVAGNTITWATTAPDGAATGTITIKMAPVGGWVKAFSATNVAAFKSTDPQSTGIFLRVDDTGTTNARLVGYEAMTDVNTGAGAFPTAPQVAGGGYWVKSSVASAAAVAWTLFSDSRKFLLHIAPHSASNAAYTGGITRGFGDDMPYRPGGDAYASSLSFSATASVGAQGDGALDAPADARHAMPRGFTGLGSSMLHVAAPFTGSSASMSGADGTLGAFPSGVDGSLRLSKKYLAEAVGAAPRCELPGLYHVPQSGVLNTFKTRNIIPGTGALAGRKLMALNPSVSYTDIPVAASTGVSFIDITGPWR